VWVRPRQAHTTTWPVDDDEEDEDDDDGDEEDEDDEEEDEEEEDDEGSEGGEARTTLLKVLMASVLNDDTRLNPTKWQKFTKKEKKKRLEKAGKRREEKRRKQTVFNDQINQVIIKIRSQRIFDQSVRTRGGTHHILGQARSNIVHCKSDGRFPYFFGCT
jgi:hypothetical protein